MNLTMTAAVVGAYAFAMMADEPPGPHAAAIQDYEKRLEGYTQLRDKARSGLPHLKDGASPEAITRHEHELAAKIRGARSTAQPGDIFSRDIAAEFRRLIAEATKGREATIVRQSLKHAEPVKLNLAVNATYPRNVPLQSTPSTLLLYLPQLPSGLEYRILGRDLVLRDTEANLIVDFISSVFVSGVVP